MTGTQCEASYKKKKIAVLDDLHKLELDNLRQTMAQNAEKHKLEMEKLHLEINIL